MSLALGMGAPWALATLAPGFDAERFTLALRLLYILSPAVAASSLSYLWTAALNAETRFAIGALGPSLQPLGALLGLFAVPGPRGVEGMAIGLTLGAFAQAGLLGWAVHRAGWSARVRSPLRVEGLVEFGHHYGTLFVGSSLMGATALVNQSLATRVSPGAAAHFNFASVAVLFALGMGARTVGQLLLPQFSAIAARGDWEGLGAYARKALRFVLLMSVPATVLLMAAARPVTQVLFERGAFTPADTDVVVAVTRTLALQIPWYLANIVAVRLLVGHPAESCHPDGRGCQLPAHTADKLVAPGAVRPCWNRGRHSRRLRIFVRRLLGAGVSPHQGVE